MSLASLTVPSATNPARTSSQASMSVDTTTAVVLFTADTSWSLVPSAV